MRFFTIDESAQELMARARRGADVDIVDTDIKEALTKLLASLNEEAQLSATGAPAMKERLLRLLCNRLRMLRDYREHPEIDNQRINKPLILCGGGRTGSTKLHKLLAASGDFKHVRFWQAHHPSLRSGDRREDPADRIREAEEFIHWIDVHAPRGRAIHAYDTHETEEETHLYEQALFGFYIFAFAYVPSFMGWLAQQDFGPQIDYFAKVIKYLQWQSYEGDTRPWLFKYPGYQSYEPLLREKFPDAVLVGTHREPVATLASSASLFSAWYCAYSDTNRDSVLGAMMLEGQAGRHELLLAARRDHPQLNVLDIGYSELMGAGDDMLRKIYAHAGIPLSETSLAAMRDWERGNGQHKHGAHRYTLEQFGLEAIQAREKYRNYTARFSQYF